MRTAALELRKPGPKPARRIPCGMCSGRGTVPVDPSDPRKGDAACKQCQGAGELSLVNDAYQARHAAERLDVPYRTVMDLIHTGQLGYIKVGRYYLVPAAEVARFLEERFTRAVTTAA